MDTPFISGITTENWLGLPGLQVKLAPFTLIAGLNAWGKTSLLQGLRFALFGTMPRDVERKDDLDRLLSRGTSAGFVEVEIDGRKVRRSIKTGKLGKVAVPPLPSLASWIFTPGSFMAEDEAKRRVALSELLGVKSTPEAIAERLLADGLPPAVVEDLRPVLLKGFAAAEKHATTRASEARGAWQGITRENYGSKKAEDWSPPTPEDVPTPEALTETEEALASVSATINGLHQRLGAASRQMDIATCEALQHKAAKLDDWKSALVRGEAKEAELLAHLAHCEAAAQGNSGITTPCPHCEKPVVIDGGSLRAPNDAPPQQLAAAQTALAQARVDLTNCRENLATVRSTIAQGEAAKARLAQEPEGEAIDVAALQRELEASQTRESTLRALANMQRSQRAGAETLTNAGARALAEHQRVQDYTRAAELLSPNGIPSVLVAGVLGPVNDWLEAASVATGWPRVRIDAEMNLWFGETPYALASESEQWRLDAAMAYALGGLSKLQVLVVDRLDVLDINSRSTVLRWLHGLSRPGAGEWQVIAAGTFKEAPRIPDVHVVWLDAITAGRQAA